MASMLIPGNLLAGGKRSYHFSIHPQLCGRRVISAAYVPRRAGNIAHWGERGFFWNYSCRGAKCSVPMREVSENCERVSRPIRSAFCSGTGF